MNKRTMVIVIGLLVGIVTVARAGELVSIKCRNCGYQTGASFGGGFLFEQETGYCVNCGKFVWVTWKRGEAGPEPLARVWDSTTGRVIPLYNCTECSKPFMPIMPIQWLKLKYCPKCGKMDLEKKTLLIVD